MGKIRLSGTVEFDQVSVRRITSYPIPTPPTPNVEICIDNSSLDQVKTTKFLGILIDDDFSWKSHTCHVSKIVSKYNGIFRKVRPFLPLDALHTLYNTLVYPYFNYCAMIWADKNNSHLHSLFLMQKRIIRTCTNSIWLAHTDPLFQSLKTLKIHDLYVLQTAEFMYKYLHDLLPHDLFDDHYFVTRQDIHPYDTRTSQDLHIRHTNTKLAENTIKTQAALVWNSLSDPLKHSPSLAIFKATLKKQLIDTYSSFD